tara:strand:- start:1683 stop:1910 length:228 start_codon:yes stop_codon:yes gene_type:complete
MDFLLAKIDQLEKDKKTLRDDNNHLRKEVNNLENQITDLEIKVRILINKNKLYAATEEQEIKDKVEVSEYYNSKK